MTTREDAHGPDYSTQVFLLLQLCNSTELRLYQEYDRPQHELMRSWCGHRAVSQYERLQAAEAENARLMGIIKELFDVIDRLDRKDLVRHIARDYWENPITEGTYRPVIPEPPKTR